LLFDEPHGDPPTFEVGPIVEFAHILPTAWLIYYSTFPPYWRSGHFRNGFRYMSYRQILIHSPRFVDCSGTRSP
jgi:hypothetical protein